MPTSFRYLGISAFETRAQGLRILVDPCITSNPISPIKVEDIEEADIILVTHVLLIIWVTPWRSRGSLELPSYPRLV